MAELPVDQLTGSKKMMLAALLQRMNQPNPSLGGNIGNALAMGLMGLYEGQDEKEMLNLALQKDAATKAAVDKATAPAPAAPVPAAPAPAPTSAPVSQAPQSAPLAAALSPGLVDAVKGFEGYSPTGKPDYKQVSSGYGTKAAYAGEPIDRATAEQRLAEELTNARKSVTAFAPNAPDGATDALTSLTYNAGPGWQKSGLGQLVSAGDWQGAAARLQQYNKAGGQVLPGLVDRRAQEASWMTNGGPAQPVQMAQAPVAPQVPANAPSQLPVPPQLAEYARNAEAAKQAGNGRAYQYWVQQATAAREQYLKSLQDIQVEQQKKLSVPPEKFSYDNREFTRDVRTGQITEITPKPQGGSSVNSYQAKERSDLRQEIMTTPQFKNVAQVAPVYKSMMDAAGKDDRASDLNLVYGLAKLMDPGSVVREGEVGMAQAVGTLPQQLQSAIMSQLQGTGRLSPEVRQALMEQAHSRMQAYNSEYQAASQMYGRVAQQRGFNPEDVVPSFGPFEKYSPMPTREQALQILRQRMQQGR